jgi:serine/threonine protein kinase
VILRQFSNPTLPLAGFAAEGAGLEQIRQTLLREDWQNQDAIAAVLEAHFAIPNDRRHAGSISDICRWIRSAGPDNSEAVVSCLTTLPPPHMRIDRLLSTMGRNKRVFLASWEFSSDLVVLKALRRKASLDAIRRELVPLACTHHNINPSRPHQNERKEIFLVEDYLTSVMDEEQTIKGAEEQACLLFDIAAALSAVHQQARFVHADVKPDNIGYRDGYYKLLDFGAACPLDQGDELLRPSGSMKTRAPELLVSDLGDVSTPIDVWSLGATMYRFISGRYPLFHPSETTPTGDQQARQLFRDELASRVRPDLYAKFVCAGDLQRSEADPNIVGLVMDMLSRHPQDRPSCRQICESLEGALRPSLGIGRGSTRLDSKTEVSIFCRALEDANPRTIPRATRRALEARLSELERQELGSEREQRLLKELLTQLRSGRVR